MKEQNITDNEKIQKLSDELHRVILDEWAIEKRCIPSYELFANVLTHIKQNIHDFTIDAFSDKVCKMLFLYMRHLEPQSFDLCDEDIGLIVKTFKYVAEINNRRKAFIDEDDLQVLYILRNVIAYKNNEQEYLRAFRVWEG